MKANKRKNTARVVAAVLAILLLIFVNQCVNT